MKPRVKKSIILIVIGIVVNVALATIKMYVGLASNSLCIMLDAMNSFLDTLTCIVTLVVFIVLLVPRSEKVPYGFGRGEYLAGFIVAVVSCVMGGLFFMRSLNRMAMPEPVYYGWQSMVLISVCLPIKLGIGLAYYFANRKICSKALKALMLDSFLDLGITATSIVAFAVTTRVDYAADAIVGIVMSVIIVAVGIKMVAENVRAIVVGDDAKDEITAITDVCKQNDVTLKKTTIHDYGYGAKVGNAYITTTHDVDTNKMQEDVRAATNAEIMFVVEKQPVTNDAGFGNDDESESNDEDVSKQGNSPLENEE